MAWTDPTDWPVGTLVNAAFMNTHIRDNFNHLYDAPACQLTHSTSQSAGSGGEIHVDFDTEVNDPDGMHSGTDDHIILSRTGLWWLSGTVKFDSSLTATSLTWARIDTLLKAVSLVGTAGNYGISLGGTEYHLVSKDITFQVNHNTGSAETLEAGPEYGVQWLHG